MHELGVADEIVKITLKHAGMNNARQVVAIRLKIGELSHLTEDILTNVLHHLGSGTIMENAEVSIKWLPITLQCECGTLYPVKKTEIVNSPCPNCGGQKFSFVSGREFFIEEIEVV
jgi:hydrogenase nickel incorporation protein HypA/HybF